jgi:hypothetical protein
MLFWTVIGAGVLLIGGPKLFALWLIPGVPPPGPFGKDK